MASPRESRKSFPKGPFLAGFVLLGCLGAGQALAPDRQEAVDGGMASEVDDAARVDTSKEGDLRVKSGPPVPATPADWMKKPPCNWEDAREVAIRGACFIRTAESPPCPRRFFEHDGKCFVAVAKAQRPDTSIGQ